MTKDFEPLSEGPLRSTDFGADAPVNVGWGSKSSQFHGSAGKSAAQTPSTPALDTLRASSEDDGRPRISWRGDSAWFAVSSLDLFSPSAEGGEPIQRRVVRVFSRVAELSSTSEPTGGLEHSLAWQPSGSIIAATQRKETGLKVVFFERNGLRRYEFDLRDSAGARVRELQWNADSSLLAVWVEREGGNHAGEFVSALVVGRKSADNLHLGHISSSTLASQQLQLDPQTGDLASSLGLQSCHHLSPLEPRKGARVASYHNQCVLTRLFELHSY